MSQGRVVFLLSRLLYYPLKLSLEREEKRVSNNVFACVAEGDSTDQDELQSGASRG